MKIINENSPESSKRFVAVVLCFILGIIAIVMLFPYKIEDNNKEVLDMIIPIFGAVITSIFAITVWDTKVKRKYTKSDEQQEQTNN